MQFWGTATVAINYSRGASLAKEVLQRIATEETDAEARSNAPYRHILNVDAAHANAEVDDLGRRARIINKEMASQLSPKWYLTSGIVAYFIGAALALAAGIGSLHR